MSPIDIAKAHPIVLGPEGAGIVESVGISGILEGESVPDIFIPQLIEPNAQGASRSRNW